MTLWPSKKKYAFSVFVWGITSNEGTLPNKTIETRTKIPEQQQTVVYGLTWIGNAGKPITQLVFLTAEKHEHVLVAAAIDNIKLFMWVVDFYPISMTPMKSTSDEVGSLLKNYYY